MSAPLTLAGIAERLDLALRGIGSVPQRVGDDGRDLLNLIVAVRGTLADLRALAATPPAAGGGREEIKEARQAIECLFIATERNVARAVQMKVEAAFSALLTAPPAPAAADLGALAEGIRSLKATDRRPPGLGMMDQVNVWGLAIEVAACEVERRAALPPIPPNAAERE